MVLEFPINFKCYLLEYPFGLVCSSLASSLTSFPQVYHDKRTIKIIVVFGPKASYPWVQIKTKTLRLLSWQCNLANERQFSEQPHK